MLINWAIVPHTLLNSYFQTSISHDVSTQLSIPVELIGSGERIYSVSIEGALDRIADVDNTIVISESKMVNVTITPNGLLTPNMFAEGTIVLYSEEGTRSNIDVILYTENLRTGPLSEFIEPATLISILILLLSFTVLPSFSLSKKSKTQLFNENSSVNDESNLSSDGWTEVDGSQDSEYYSNAYLDP